MTVATSAKAPSTLGERVRAARHEAGLSQAQLAGSELTKGFISQVESSLVRPSIRSLQIIATRLGRSLDYFVGDESLTAAKRITFHRLAAEAAVERRDWDQARSHVTVALALAPEAHERGRLLHLAASADARTGEREAAFDKINEALVLVEPSSDPLLASELLYLRGWVYGDIGQLVASNEALEAAKAIVEKYEVVEPRTRAKLLVALGTNYRRLNRTAKAMSAYEAGLAVASRSSELDLAARGYMGIAASLYDSGDLDSAITSYRRALELFERVSDTSFELSALQSLAAVQFEQGRLSDARALAEQTLRRAGEVGDAHWAAAAEVVLARVALEEGAPDEAMQIAGHAERALAESDDELQRSDALRVIGGAHDARGEFEQSDTFYRRALQILDQVGDRADRAAVATEYARKLRARGEIDAAFEMLEDARGTTAAR